MIGTFDNSAGGEAKVWRRGTNFGNGSCLDAAGNVITCEHGSRRVSITTSPATVRCGARLRHLVRQKRKLLWKQPWKWQRLPLKTQVDGASRVRTM